MKDVLIKIGLTILCAFVYTSVNQQPKELLGIAWTIIFLFLTIAIWRRNYSNTNEQHKAFAITMPKKSHFSGCLLTISIFVVVLFVLAAFGAIFHGLEQLVKSIPWWLYIIIVAAFMYLYYSKDEKE